jgi:RimJ/RimL family protein N-acetyltransferase
MTEQIIAAGKVMLRPKRLEDAWDDYTWRVDGGLAAMDAAAPLRQSFEQFLRHYKDELHHHSPWSQRYSITTLDEKHIGNCMSYDINVSFGEAELGIMIGDRDYWNQSYGYDSMIALVDHMFTSTSLCRLYVHTLEWNKRARRCFEKCGFTLRGIENRSSKSFALMDIFRNQWYQVRDEKLPRGNGVAPSPSASD